MPSLTITIPGAPRTKGNGGRIIQRGTRRIRVGTEAHGLWRTAALWRLKPQVVAAGRLLPIEVRVNCEAVYYRSTASRSDLDNHHKALGDVLQTGRVVANDTLLTWDGSRLDIDRVAPRIVATLTWAAPGHGAGLRVVRHACACGATLVITDQPQPAAALMAIFLREHQGGACGETDYLAARSVQERIAAARACPRCGADPETCECPCPRCASVNGYCECVVVARG